jgi:hypothetical protein
VEVGGATVTAAAREVCACPVGYSGAQCSQCAWTHARVGLQCLPCACHGHAACIDGTCHRENIFNKFCAAFESNRV